MASICSGVEARHEAVHDLAPGPEAVLLRPGALGQAGHGPLEGVAVQVGHARAAPARPGAPRRGGPASAPSAVTAAIRSPSASTSNSTSRRPAVGQQRVSAKSFTDHGDPFGCLGAPPHLRRSSDAQLCRARQGRQCMWDRLFSSTRAWRRWRGGRPTAPSKTARWSSKDGAHRLARPRADLPGGRLPGRGGARPGRPLDHAGADRLPHAPGLRRRPRPRVRAAPEGRDLRGDRARRRRHPLDGGGDPRGDEETLVRVRQPPPVEASCWPRASRRSRSSPATASTWTAELKQLRVARAARATSTRSRCARPSWAPTPCRRSSKGRRRLHLDGGAMMPPVAACRPGRRGRRLLRGHRLHARSRPPRVFEADARGPGPAGQAARRPALGPGRRGAGRPLRRALRRPPGVHHRGRRRRHGRSAGTVAVLLPGAFYVLRETKLPCPSRWPPDCNPGSAPVTSLLLMLSMGCTLFGLTPEEALPGSVPAPHDHQGFAEGRSRAKLGVAGAEVERPAVRRAVEVDDVARLAGHDRRRRRGRQGNRTGDRRANRCPAGPAPPRSCGRAAPRAARSRCGNRGPAAAGFRA